MNYHLKSVDSYEIRMNYCYIYISFGFISMSLIMVFGVWCLVFFGEVCLYLCVFYVVGRVRALAAANNRYEGTRWHSELQNCVRTRAGTWPYTFAFSLLKSFPTTSRRWSFSPAPFPASFPRPFPPTVGGRRATGARSTPLGDQPEKVWFFWVKKEHTERSAFFVDLLCFSLFCGYLCFSYDKLNNKSISGSVEEILRIM